MKLRLSWPEIIQPRGSKTCLKIDSEKEEVDTSGKALEHAVTQESHEKGLPCLRYGRLSDKVWSESQTSTLLYL